MHPPLHPLANSIQGRLEQTKADYSRPRQAMADQSILISVVLPASPMPLFCRSEQSVSSLNICTADSPPHTGQHNTYQLLDFFVFHCITFFFRLLGQYNGDSPSHTGLDKAYQLLYFYGFLCTSKIGYFLDFTVLYICRRFMF